MFGGLTRSFPTMIQLKKEECVRLCTQIQQRINSRWRFAHKESELQELFELRAKLRALLEEI